MLLTPSPKTNPLATITTRTFIPSSSLRSQRRIHHQDATPPITRASVNDGVLYMPTVSLRQEWVVPTAAAKPEGRYCACGTFIVFRREMTPKIEAKIIVGVITCGGNPSLFTSRAQSTQTYQLARISRA